jgi:hypothetical protein
MNRVSAAGGRNAPIARATPPTARTAPVAASVHVAHAGQRKPRCSACDSAEDGALRGAGRQSSKGAHRFALHIPIKAPSGSGAAVAATHRPHRTWSETTAWETKAACPTSLAEQGAVKGASSRTIELVAWTSIHAAQTGAPFDVTTNAWGPVRNGIGSIPAARESTHACSSGGGWISTKTVAVRNSEASSPTPSDRPPSKASARAQARSAASVSIGATRRHRIARTRSTSAICHAASGRSAWARSRASADARARSTLGPSRAPIASRA